MIKLSGKEKIELQKVAEKYHLRLLLVFGSAVTGRTHKESDLDVAYLSARALTIREEAELIVAIGPILKNNCVDLANISLAPPLLLYALAQNSEILYELNPFEFYNLRAYAFKRYIEAAPIFQLQAERAKIKMNAK
ncbi:MAG TPA: nucleotidyltransferase domain-containing protein [Candidatus Paceibacterota bacterium]